LVYDTVLLSRLFNTFNTDRTRSGNYRVTYFALLKIEINGHTENINTVITDLNSMDMFLKYDWLVKHNWEVNWNKETILFTRYPISFKSRTRKVIQTEEINKEH